ncbi:UDP-glucosyltransferase 74AE2-like isoform X1 [Apium graveolens]|uniref:UDP-glucosyltransferase 74AE2-like isoform X1 n=1 Tax=Apium graveolens TaxID=4045 RepID=UPI003D7B7335
MSRGENEEALISSKPHIMLISFPLQGHLNPMVQFSKRLISRGIKVTLVTTTSLDISSHADSSSITIEHFQVDRPSTEGRSSSDAIDEYLSLLETSITRNLPGVIEKQKANGCPVKFLIYDALMPYALDVCDKAGIQGVAFVTHSSAVFAIYYHVYQRALDIDLLDELSSVTLPSLPVLGFKDLPSYLSNVGSYPGLLTLCMSQFRGLEKAYGLMFNTFEKLEGEVVNWLSSKWKIMTIGPSVPSMFLDKRLADDRDYGLSLFKPDGDACIKWLDGKDSDSVVYVSFGSLANLEQDYMDEIAWGLLDSKCSFIWVVRDTEKSKLSEKFVEESADRGLIVNWSPQLEVLAHKAVGSFMTHCGWNSTLEALSLGVPMMVVPQWTDQTTNAKYIVDVWQTGVRVKAHDKEKITREDVTKSVKDVMEGTKREELKANALKFKEMALEAMSEGGSSDKNIDDFIAEIVTSSTST